jgi:hypothetical protein
MKHYVIRDKTVLRLRPHNPKLNATKLVWGKVQDYVVTVVVVVVNADGVRLRLRTAATKTYCLSAIRCMGTEPRWKDTDGKTMKELRKNLSQYHFFHYKSHTD